ncbi:S-layer homology domain-containing protein [Paenibacillus radicis (ex Xue et al. 2023)]|uniref:S-layer homology domain-containing protein n=1 Tax=Paenibacillus radicis (ex Xue et al. 2023) TaxID=2972489 RepID=A0ABT1YFX8_9BACL|nr:S-layer homology domain-containing protein [Paenibacillus radicis (ex Xue et al. 2023)]MCR8631289.1 S-layer homology domain-containing protein [Paenibacillus radicis (ex Xue et al. 2023)]
MRRWTVILLSFLLCFGSMLPVATAATAPTTVNATYDSITGKVVVSGNFGSTPGKIVTLQVRNPNNQMQQLDQGISGANGAYQFSFSLINKVNGTYIVSVGGEEAAVAATTFQVASTQNVTVNASVSGTTINISGNMGSTEGNTVNVEVRNPLNEAIYTDKGKSGANGAYQFSYTMSQRWSGVYTVKVWGIEGDAVKITTFSIQSDSSSSTSPTSGSGGGAPSPTVPISQVGTQIELTAKLDPSTGVATAALDAAQYASALQQAQAEGLKNITVTIPDVEGAKQYALKATADFFSSTSSNVNLTIATDIGTVVIQPNILKNIDLSAAKEITLTIGLKDKNDLPTALKSQIGNRPVIDLTISVDGKVIPFNNPNTSVTVSVPYQPTAEEMQNPEHIVVWYIDEQGSAQAVPTGRYDSASGMVTFKTSHFSSYAIVYDLKSFQDLSSVSWAKKSIEVMASKGIISGVSDTSFNPGANITRADFMILLTKSLGLEASISSNFNDVAPNDYYYKAVGVAKQLGLAEGQGDNQFNPREQISRQDMIVLISRALKQAGKWSSSGTADDLASFTDKSKVAAYAANDIAAMVSAGVVEGSGNLLNPTGNATRAEAAVLLYRIYNKY